MISDLFQSILYLHKPNNIISLKQFQNLFQCMILSTLKFFPYKT